MMSKKYYVKIAEIIKGYNKDIKEHLTDDFVEMLDDNPNFNEPKFRDYIWGGNR